jgi:hypothetical protein
LFTFFKTRYLITKLLFEREKENHPFMVKEGEGGGKRGRQGEDEGKAYTGEG